jgi:hypothetical protein
VDAEFVEVLFDNSPPMTSDWPSWSLELVRNARV